MIGMPPWSRDRPRVITKPFHDLHLAVDRSDEDIPE